MGSEEGNDRSERRGIVRGRARFWGCVVDVVALVDCDQDVILILTMGFKRELTSAVDHC